MGGRNPSTSSMQPGSTPQALPSGNPTSLSGIDHSFTLQTIMELQKSCGALSAQLTALSGQIDRMERNASDGANRFDDKLDGLADSIRTVENKIQIVSKVGGILFGVFIVVAGVAWTVTQDAFKDIAKTAINSTIASKSADGKPTNIDVQPVATSNARTPSSSNPQ